MSKIDLLLMSEERFREIVAEEMDTLPEEFASLLDTIPIIVEDEWWVTPVLFAGRPRISWKTIGGPKPALADWHREETHPPFKEFLLTNGRKYFQYSNPGSETYGMCCFEHDGPRILIFRGSVLRANPDEDALRFQIRNLIEHELAHALGMNEEQVAAAHHRKRSEERIDSRGTLAS